MSAMKVAVLFDAYEPFHEAKEGNLVLGLREAGAEVVLVTAEKPSMRDYRAPFPLAQAPRDRFSEARYWRDLGVDAVIVYTFLHWRYNTIARAIRDAGKRVVFRADSDGRIGAPVLSRRWLIAGGDVREDLRNRARRVAWRLIPRLMAERRLGHLDIPHAVFIETPGAFASLARFLTHWHRADLIAKVRVIPMAVSDLSATAPVSAQRRPSVVAVGRWEDRRQKNTFAAVRVLCRFLDCAPDYEGAIIGSGEEILRAALVSVPAPPHGRLKILGSLPQQEVIERLGRARILFMPSHWEGFALAAGEAACMGCSVAGSPLDIVDELAQGARFGTVARDFGDDALLDALRHEAERWRRNERDPLVTADYWRRRINRRQVGQALMALLEEMAGAPLSGARPPGGDIARTRYP